MAVQRSGVELGSGDCKPEPDIAVIDTDYGAGQRFVERVYLFGEIVSDTDNLLDPVTRETWIDVKRRIYLDHAPCEAVVIIEQDRMEVRLDVRTRAGWRSDTLIEPQAELVLPSFGVRCAPGVSMPARRSSRVFPAHDFAG